VTRNKRQGSDPFGFTFIEIILVVILLSAVAVLSLPNLGKTFSAFQFQNLVQDMAYVLRYAQSRAIIKGRPVRFMLDSTNRHYWLLQQGEGQEDFSLIANRQGRKFRIEQDVGIEMTVSYIEFFPNGQISPANIKICRKQDCLVISTEIQRGQVLVFVEPKDG
jgi:Tfp pilus assembly protein FimT